MLPPLIARRLRRSDLHSGERGITLALVALAMFSIIAMAGLSIDVGTLYQASAEAQRAADTAALAAARMISVSGITGDPTNGMSDGSWADICGGTSSPATEVAIAVAQQNTVGGAAVPAGSVTVTYSAGSAPGTTSTDCTGLGAGFGVNPVVTVKVTQAGLPTYFSRIWGRTGSSASATATAEAFNPSNSAAYASNMVPVQPRCVKPWIVPNQDPLNPSSSCTGASCNKFVDTTTGRIENPGVLPVSGGVIGEKFWLLPDCPPTGLCSPLAAPPQANVSASGGKKTNLQYVPGQASFSSTAVPSDGSEACTAVASATGYYAQAIAGCDQSTQYQCGKAGLNTVDLSENPAAGTPGDTTNGTQCLIHQGSTSGVASSGQDTLLPAGGATPNYPFQIEVGSSNPLTGTGIGASDLISSSTSIVSVPIYDNSTTTTFGATTTAVTIVGFLQVFIHRVDANGNVLVTVMNVSGCSNAVPSGAQALQGSSPVPVRLITPP